MRASRPTSSEPITVLDLFAGCGGFTQGFHEFRPDGTVGGRPAFHSIAAVEHNKAAAATYAMNFGSGRPDKSLPEARVYFGDIEEWKPTEETLHADVIVGGPPCQGFSALNRKKKGSERNRLWEEYVRIVAEVRPKIFVIENVDRFLKSDEFQNLLKEVKPEGLLADYRLVDPPGHQPSDTEEGKTRRYLLNSADYGAVQARRRAIVIGVRRDAEGEHSMSYPDRSHFRPPKNTAKRSDQLFETVDGVFRSWNAVDKVFDESEKIPLRGPDLPDTKDHVSEVDAVVPGVFATRDLHIRRNPEILSLARYGKIPPGGNRKDLRGWWFTIDESGAIEYFQEPKPAGVKTRVIPLSTESWDNHNTGTGDVMGRLRRGEPSVTIRTEFFKPEKGRYLHPTANRPITHYEAARIQGFPLTFRWCGSKTEIAMQIGNAVPIPLGRAIASAIHTFLRG
ncbi:DNA cytosine methyltransferase [Streptomyces sp. NPDC090082]|uniref:DNA cytosine methyltransferase n=1 Tax=unclassified Streptomyces TaxID=2593676 RepID=UPI003819385C